MRGLNLKVISNRNGLLKIAAAGLMLAVVGVVRGQGAGAESERGLNLTSLAQAIEVSGETTAQNAAPTEKGRAIYGRMARYLDKQKSYYVELVSTTTLSSVTGSHSSTGLSRVWLRRPDCLVWTTQSDLGGSALAIDGKTQTLFLPALSRYTVNEFKGSLDSHLASMASPYGMLATALFSEYTSVTLHGVLSDSPRWTGSQYILGVPCDELIVPVRGNDVKLWVSQGSIPLPVKMELTGIVPPMPGETQGLTKKTDVSFRWRVNMEISDNVFQLNLPETAQKVDRLGGPIAMATAKKPAQTGKTSSKGKSSKTEKSKSSTDKSFNVPFELPPNLRKGSTSDAGLPSLSGGKSDDDIVAAAIRGGTDAKAVSGGGFQPVERVPAPPPPASAAKVPPITMNLLSGGNVDLNSYRGKVVVLDFWATWCGPCRKSLPILNQVAQQWRGRGVEFFAVNMGEDSGKVRQFWQQQGMSVPVALDAAGQLASMFGVGGIPHLVVIGKDGTVKGVHTGADSKLAELLNRDLETALQ